MPLPPNVETCTVYGNYIDIDGNPAVGNITFRPHPARLTNVVADAVLISAPIVVDLNANGWFTVDLAATDDVDLNPVDWTWHAAVRTHWHDYDFHFLAPTGGNIDISEISPIAGSAGDAVVVGPPGPPGIAIPGSLTEDPPGSGLYIYM